MMLLTTPRPPKQLTCPGFIVLTVYSRFWSALFANCCEGTLILCHQVRIHEIASYHARTFVPTDNFPNSSGISIESLKYIIGPAACYLWALRPSLLNVFSFACGPRAKIRPRNDAKMASEWFRRATILCEDHRTKFQDPNEVFQERRQRVVAIS